MPSRVAVNAIDWHKADTAVAARVTSADNDSNWSMSNLIFHWLITVFLLLWGCAYAGLVTFSFFLASPEHWSRLVSEGRISAEYASYIAEIPTWVIAASCAAALTRLLGAVALVGFSALAVPLYSLSLALVMIIMFRGFILADVASVISKDQIVLEMVFLLLSVLAVLYSFYARQIGLLK